MEKIPQVQIVVTLISAHRISDVANLANVMGFSQGVQKDTREQQSTARAAEMSVTSNTRLISMACTFDFLQALFWESWQPFHCQFHLYQLFVHRSVKYYIWKLNLI